MSRCFTSWLAERKQYSSRQLLVIDTNAQTLTLICQHFANTLLISDQGCFFDKPSSAPTNITQLSPKQLTHHLGLEYQAVIIDCSAGLSANAIFTSAGLISATGLLVLITPNPASWSQYFAANTAIPFSYADTHSISYFALRLKNILENDKYVAWYGKWTNTKTKEYNDEICHLPIADLSKRAELLFANDGTDSDATDNDTADSDSTDSAHTENGISLSGSQTAALLSIQGSWEETSSCHFIGGNRGRGKTTLLAHLCNTALKSASSVPFRQIIICAPSKAQRTTITAKVPATLNPELPIKEIAPDQISEVDEHSLLLVDEAASISPHLLTQLCDNTAHKVIAATTQGYEGSGKGLLYRWLPNLKEPVSLHKLKSPFRWQQGDVLEALTDEIFNPTVNLNETALIQTQPSDSPSLIKIDKATLSKNIDLSDAVFALLQGAHYQFTPTDILRTFDADDHELWIYTDPKAPYAPNNLIGVVCTICEGPFSKDSATLKHSATSSINVGTDNSSYLCEAIAMGTRRVQGHMSLQAFSSGLNEPQILNNTVHRVHRIAVWPNLQGRGFGSDMLRQLQTQLTQSKQAMLSSSLGLTPSLYTFWKKNGFILCRLGQRSDTSSGTLSGHFLQKGASILTSYHTQFHAHLSLDLNYLYDFNYTLHKLIPTQAIEDINNEYDHKMVKSLAHKKCKLFINDLSSYAMSRAAIYCLIQELALDDCLNAYKALHTKHLSKQQKHKHITEIRCTLRKVFTQ